MVAMAIQIWLLKESACWQIGCDFFFLLVVFSHFTAVSLDVIIGMNVDVLNFNSIKRQCFAAN